MINVSQAGAVATLEQQLKTLAQDRDYWRRQHDLVMEDWKDDLAQWEGPASALKVDDGCRDAIGRLLRFYDPGSGMVRGRCGPDFLSDAFANALRAHQRRD